MKLITSLLIYPFLVAGTMFYFPKAKAFHPAADITLVASTPGDEPIKYLFEIPPDKKVDFIRWELVLSGSKSIQNKFILNLVFGESQPNTSGFKGGGEKLTIQGQYSISQYSKRLNTTIYHLKGDKLPAGFSMIKLTDNIFHLLTPGGKLMIGNGGWSYTLNRKQPLRKASAHLPVLATFSDLPADTTRQIIFEGRTPCLDFAAENGLTVLPDCFKLKWKLVLNKDTQTLLPTTYNLYRTNSRETAIVGKWAILKGIPSNTKAIVYQLDPDKPEKSISLLLGDENVAFFLHKDNQLYTGNENFSYTLNKRKQ